MFLMSKCKYFIIPNSTFSWWGSWLSTREGKVVICPKHWVKNDALDTKDLIVDGWIKL